MNIIGYVVLIIGLGVAAASAATEPDIVINTRALDDVLGAEDAADVGARITPERAPDDALADQSFFDPIDPSLAGVSLVRGESLQILYSRGSLVIPDANRETLETWTRAHLDPGARVEILSYSGALNPAWEATGQTPGEEMMAYSLHEAIRTAFKRAIVIRDVLIEEGVDETNIILRAIGPARDGGAPERVDVISLGKS